MLESRRKFIKNLFSITAYAFTASSGLIYSSWAQAQWLKERFKATTYDELIKQYFPDTEFISSHKIKFSRLPRTAENGAIVPIKITSTIKNIEKISILVEKNPHPLIAEFFLSPVMEPSVSARIKMAESSDVIVIIEAEGKFYRQSKYVKVTIGGCGG